MKKYLLIIIYLLSYNILYAQYNMQNLTVYDCEGTLKDSESNALNPNWYSHNENFNFTICPTNALQITITFTFFSTEPINDYVTIYDGPDNTYPILGGPYSGTNLPPQIISSGCITIEFISDQNIAEEGFELQWETDVFVPSSPAITLPSSPTCSTTIFNIELDQLIHCDSVATAQIYVGGQINQNVNATALNCINDSTNTIELNLNPGLNESGLYNIYFQSYFTDDCNNIWNLSTNTQFIIDDCPLQVDLQANTNIICLGDCVELWVEVEGGDSSSYNYVWNPTWNNSAGIWISCPTTTTQYMVTVSDNGTSIPTTDTITINVVNPPVVQNSITVCQTDPPVTLIANPIGGTWSGSGIINSSAGLFSSNGLPSGTYSINYGFGGCNDNLDITVLEINAGDDISVCVNTPTFNLNSSSTTPGGIWSGCPCIQANGDITVGGSPIIIEAIYSLPNGCSDTLLVSVVDNITMPAGTTLCQQSGNYGLVFTPPNGIWSVLPNNPQLSSNCINAIDVFPYQEGWEGGFNGWIPDPANDFDWIINNGGTPSAATGPQSAIEGINYIYTESSNPNNPDKRSGIISPCLNLSEYNNPVLHFWYHKYGAGQGSFSVDISTDNGVTWNWNHWVVVGDLGNQWNEAAIDLSTYNTSEVLIRLRVKTGDWQSDVAIDKLSILGGPITIDGNFITNVAISGTHHLIYSIEGCNDFVDIIVNEIDAGNDQIACPTQSPFNLTGSPNNGIWSGNNITNTNLGTFNPSLNLGLDIVTYSLNGCVDTTEIWVVETDVQIDSLFVCINSGNQNLDAIRIPWNGAWSGIGIINPNFPGIFNPSIAGSGIHNVSYSANTCTDNLIIQVFPKSILSDTLICSTSPDIVLNANPPGGYWLGNGIINGSTGLFSPSQLGVGTHYIGYISPNNCTDTFSINIYDNPTLTMSGFNNYYCNKDTTIQINVTPSGGILSGNGIINNTFNPALAGTGYHTIIYSYGTGNCIVHIDTVIFVDNQLITTTYQTEDSICKGELVSIGVNANGGVGNYFFNWNNGLSNSFEHLISPLISTDYIVTSSDGCSQDIEDTISIHVLPDFSLSFLTSEKQCYGETGHAIVEALPAGNYLYSWNTTPINDNDTIYEDVNKNYRVEVTDQITQCIISDTITIPGYDRIDAYFIKNTTNCLSLTNNNELQLLSNSIFTESELSQLSYWNFGDGIIIPFEPNINPSHIYSDTGEFRISLVLINKGNCIDSLIDAVCVISDNKLYAPNSFTPDGDNCNDLFYLSGLGYFEEFNLKIYYRWGGSPIYESEEIVFTDTYSDINNCNDNNPYQEYYKMGEWDGKLNNGEDAELGVYVFFVTYLLPNESKHKYLLGNITLLR